MPRKPKGKEETTEATEAPAEEAKATKQRDFGVVYVATRMTVPVLDPDSGEEVAQSDGLVKCSSDLRVKAEGEQWVIDHGQNDVEYVVVRELRSMTKKTVTKVKLV
jgi:hypothetical protein